MNELNVIVKQTPGTIGWNHEELKAQLRAEMETYEKLVYTDANIGEAKKDLATLRKLTKQIDERRSEIKKSFLVPYNDFERQAKELKEIINGPIDKINANVKDYELRRKKAKLEKIKEYFVTVFQAEELPEDVGNTLWKNIYSDRWLNATMKDSEWQDAIRAGVNRTKSELDAVTSGYPDFAEEALSEYKKNLDLTSAMQYVTALRRQKEIAEQKVREEQEARARREAEERERKIREEAERASAAEQPEKVPEASIPRPEPKPEPIIREEPETQTEARRKPETGIMIRVYSEDDLNALVDYCNFSQIKYEVVRS